MENSGELTDNLTVYGDTSYTGSYFIHDDTTTYISNNDLYSKSLYNTWYATGYMDSDNGEISYSYEFNDNCRYMINEDNSKPQKFEVKVNNEWVSIYSSDEETKNYPAIINFLKEDYPEVLADIILNGLY